MIIDAIADLHGHFPQLEGGDLLIVAGDLTARDTMYEYSKFIEWLLNQQYKKKILIAGNHDNEIQKGHIYFDTKGVITYLCDSGAEFEGLKVWGSPWTKTFLNMNPHCKAFTVDTEEKLFKKWSLISDDIDILITHSPPYGILDKNVKKEHCGSTSLRNYILDGSYFKKLKLHVFGHLHETGGKIFETSLTKFVNASHVNERYEPVNSPVRIIL